MTASASAALSSVGPVDPSNNFPSYYKDANGVALQICQDGLPNCLAGPELLQDVHAAGGDAEAFYWAADATRRTSSSTTRSRPPTPPTARTRRSCSSARR